MFCGVFRRPSRSTSPRSSLFCVKMLLIATLCLRERSRLVPHKNVHHIHTSTSDAEGRATDLRPSLHGVFDALLAAIGDLESRIAALESGEASQQNIMSFCDRRASWTVRHLAD